MQKGYRGTAQENDWIGTEHYEKLDRFTSFIEQQREARNNKCEPITFRIGPSRIKPPSVPSPYSGLEDFFNEDAAEEDTVEAHTLAIQNERLMTAIREVGHAPHLPQLISETAAQVFIQGIYSSSEIVELQERKSWKPVQIRECRSSSDPIVIHVKGVTTTLVIDECKRIRVFADSIVKKVVLISCKEVEVVMIHRPPPVIAFGSSKCTIALSREVAGLEIESMGCTEMKVAWVDSMVNDYAQLRHMELFHDLFKTPHAKSSAHTIPDVLKVRVNGPRLTCWHAPPAAEELGRPLPVAGVGLYLEMDAVGAKVRRLDRMAMKYGSVELGDYLLRVGQKDIDDLSLPQIQALLVGRQGSETPVTVGRFVDVNVVQTSECVAVHWDSAPNGTNINCANSFYRALPTASPSALLADNASSQEANEEGRGVGVVGDVGLVLGRDREGAWRVEWVAAGGAAAESGRLRRGDAVLAVDGNRLSDLDDPAVHALTQGPPGTTVTLTLVSEEAEQGGEYRSVSLQRQVGSLGLKLRQGARGLWVVDALVLGGSAEASGRVRAGDVVHSIDGVCVAGRSGAECQALSEGALGSRAVVAVLLAAAAPADPWRSLHDFAQWRAVALLRLPAPPPHAAALVPVPRSDSVHYRTHEQPYSPRPAAGPAEQGTEEGREEWVGVGLDVEQGGEEVLVSGVDPDDEAGLAGVAAGVRVLLLDDAPVPRALSAGQVARGLRGPAGSRVMVATSQEEGGGGVAVVLLVRGLAADAEFVRTRQEKRLLLRRAAAALPYTTPHATPAPPLALVGPSRRVVLRAQSWEGLGVQLAGTRTGQAWVCGVSEGGAAQRLGRVLVGDVVEAVGEGAGWPGQALAGTVGAMRAAVEGRGRVALQLRWSMAWRHPADVESFLLRASHQRNLELRRWRAGAGWWGAGFTLEQHGEATAAVGAVFAGSDAEHTLRPGQTVLAVNGRALRDCPRPLTPSLIAPVSGRLVLTVEQPNPR